MDKYTGFSYTAMAQLQLGLLGMDEEFMEETNKQIRDAISGTDGVGFANMVGPIFDMMLAVGKNDKYATASDVVSMETIYHPSLVHYLNLFTMLESN